MTEGSKTVQREVHNSILDVFKIELFGMKMGCIEFGVNDVFMNFSNTFLLKYMSLPPLLVTKIMLEISLQIKVLFSICDESIIFHDINEPVHAISNNVVCAVSKASDQPAHTRSLIRAFASRLSIL